MYSGAHYKSKQNRRIFLKYRQKQTYNMLKKELRSSRFIVNIFSFAIFIAALNKIMSNIPNIVQPYVFELCSFRMTACCTTSGEIRFLDNGRVDYFMTSWVSFIKHRIEDLGVQTLRKGRKNVAYVTARVKQARLWFILRTVVTMNTRQ